MNQNLTRSSRWDTPVARKIVGNLNLARNRKGIMKKIFAETWGVHQSVATRIFSGEQPILVTQLWDAANILGVPIKWFFTNDPETEASPNKNQIWRNR